MLVESMMYRNPLNIGPEATFLQTQSFMQEHGIRHLPVVDKENRIQGIITDRDLRSAAPSDTASASNQELRYRLRRMRVSDIMTPAGKLVTVTPDTIVETAVKLMHDHKFGSLPVVADGKLVGLVTLTDILGFFVDVMGLDVEGTRLTMTMEDVPGQLFSILKVIEKYHVNIISIFSPTSLVNKKRHAVFRIKTQDYEGIVKELNAGGYEVLSADVWPARGGNPGSAESAGTPGSAKSGSPGPAKSATTKRPTGKSAAVRSGPAKKAPAKKGAAGKKRR
jgi:acetoin utilization protein AcuB